MKNLILFIIFTFVGLNPVVVKSQDIRCEVYLLEDSEVALKIISGQTLTDDELMDKTLLSNSKTQVELSKSLDWIAIKKNIIVIQFFKNGQAVTNDQVNLKSISFSPNGKPIDMTTITSTDKGIAKEVSDCVDDNIITGTIVQITIATNDNKNFNFYFKIRNVVQNYGANIFRHRAGLWLPINMYSASIDKSVNGVRFTAMPIGVAGGTKVYTSKSYYWGLSGILNYTLSPARKEDDSFLASNFSLGGLLDFGGYAYLGYTFPLNLDKNNPLKNQFVAGFTIKLGDLIKQQ